MNISEFRILIVDDEEDLLDLVAESFESEGFCVDKVLSGEEALELCKKTNYDAVLSDHHMPGMGGLELFEKLQSIYEKRCHFYLCTGDFSVDGDDFKARGGCDVISKPYDLFELIARIENNLRNS